MKLQTSSSRGLAPTVTGVLAAALPLVGCATDLREPPASTTITEIKDGTVWDPWAHNTQTWTRNVVRVGGCTGTLLDYEWVMTAAHCFGDTPPAASSVTVRHLLADGSEEKQVGAELFISPGWPSPGVDVALLRLAKPMHPGVSSLPLYAGTTDSLVDQSVVCAGYGAIDVGPSCSADAPACPSGQSCSFKMGACLTPNDGTLRTATFAIIEDDVDPSIWYQFDVPNASGQLELPGDSGSTCWNGSALTGVMKAANAYNYNRQTAIPAARSWIQSLVTPTRVAELNRPGARCQPAYNAPIAYTSTGGVNGGPEGAVMLCPIDRPIEANFVRAPAVWVFDQHPTSDVCCHLQSKSPNGAQVSGAEVCSSGASSASQTLVLPSIADSFTFSQYSISCSIPAATAAGAQSGIDGYRVDLMTR